MKPPSAVMRFMFQRNEYLRFNYRNGFGTVGHLIEEISKDQVEELHSFLWEEAGMEDDNIPSDVFLFRPNTHVQQMLNTLLPYLESHDMKDLRSYDTASLLLFSRQFEIFNVIADKLDFPAGYTFNQDTGWFNVDTAVTEIKFQDYRRGARKGTERTIPSVDPFIHLNEYNGLGAPELVQSIIPKTKIDALVALA